MRINLPFFGSSSCFKLFKNERRFLQNGRNIHTNVNELLYEVYQDEEELEHYKNALSFEYDELHDISALNVDQRALLKFDFGPNSRLFETEKVTLINKYGKHYEPIDLLKTDFIKHLQNRYKVMKNHKKEFIRNLTRIEYLGKFMFKETTFKFLLLDLERSQGSFIRLNKIINRKIIYNKKVDMSLYFSFGDGKETDPNHRIIASRLSGGRQIKKIQPFYVFMGMKYMEDPDGFKQVVKQVLIEADMTKVNYFLRNSKLIDCIFDESNEETIRKINKRLQFLLPDNLNLNSKIFSSIIRPKLLPYRSTRLPSLAKLTRPQKTTQLLQLALLNPYSSSIEAHHSWHLKRMSESLDAFGDIVLKRISLEFFNSILAKDINHISIFTDHLVLNSNIFFGRLAEVYELEKGIEDKTHQFEILDRMKNDIQQNGKRTIFELFGDLLEKYVAVLYIDNPENCKKWLFEIFQLVYDILVIDKYNGKILDKEYLQKSAMNGSLRYLKN